MTHPDAPTPARATRRGSIVEALVRAIFTGQLRGGDRLVEEELAVTLDVSRTPIREALGELAGTRLIELKPNRGAVVRPFGEPQLRELYHLRRLLESEAARMAAGRIDVGQLRDVAERTRLLLEAKDRDEKWTGKVLVLDHEFHDLISDSSGSERLAAEIRRYRAVVDVLREAVGNTNRAQDVALQEHMRIIDALLIEDASGAAEAMRRHIDRGTEAAAAALNAMASRRPATRGVTVRGDRRRNRRRRAGSRAK